MEQMERLRLLQRGLEELTTEDECDNDDKKTVAVKKGNDNGEHKLLALTDVGYNVVADGKLLALTDADNADGMPKKKRRRRRTHSEKVIVVDSSDNEAAPSSRARALCPYFRRQHRQQQQPFTFPSEVAKADAASTADANKCCPNGFF